MVVHTHGNFVHWDSFRILAMHSCTREDFAHWGRLCILMVFSYTGCWVVYCPCIRTLKKFGILEKISSSKNPWTPSIRVLRTRIRTQKMVLHTCRNFTCWEKVCTLKIFVYLRKSCILRKLESMCFSNCCSQLSLPFFFFQGACVSDWDLQTVITIVKKTCLLMVAIIWMHGNRLSMVRRSCIPSISTIVWYMSKMIIAFTMQSYRGRIRTLREEIRTLRGEIRTLRREIRILGSECTKNETSVQ